LIRWCVIPGILAEPLFHSFWPTTDLKWHSHWLSVLLLLEHCSLGIDILLVILCNSGWVPPSLQSHTMELLLSVTLHDCQCYSVQAVQLKKTVKQPRGYDSLSRRVAVTSKHLSKHSSLVPVAHLLGHYRKPEAPSWKQPLKFLAVSLKILPGGWCSLWSRNAWLNRLAGGLSSRPQYLSAFVHSCLCNEMAGFLLPGAALAAAHLGYNL
jgi:hypothetical protein